MQSTMECCVDHLCVKMCWVQSESQASEDHDGHWDLSLPLFIFPSWTHYLWWDYRSHQTWDPGDRASSSELSFVCSPHATLEVAQRRYRQAPSAAPWEEWTWSAFPDEHRESHQVKSSLGQRKPVLPLTDGDVCWKSWNWMVQVTTIRIKDQISNREAQN